MFTPRDYQESGIKAGVEYFRSRSKSPSIIVAPTAAGKSLYIGGITVEVDEPMIVFQPSKELLEQNYEKLLAFGGEAEIYSASKRKKNIGKVTYATIGSVKNIGAEFKSLGVKKAIIDECHYVNPNEESMYMKFFRDAGIHQVLGLTATPIRLKQFGGLVSNYSQLCIQTRTRPKFFKKIIHVTQIPELVSRGYWSKLRYEIYDFDESVLMYNSSGAEFTEQSISRAVEANGTNNNIYLRLKSLLGERKKIIVFLDSVYNAQKMADLFGDRAACVSANTPKKERERIINEFKHGDLQIVTNYSALGVGFDAPNIDCVILGRPTNSFVNIYQYIGRGTRISDTKEDCLVIDFCNNVKRFGTLETITLEEFNGTWDLFNGDILLTSVPMDLPEKVTKAALIREKEEKERKLEEERQRLLKAQQDLKELAESPRFWFGRHDGEKIEDVPIPYLMYIAGKDFNANSDKTRVLKAAVINYLNEISVKNATTVQKE